MSLFLSKFVNKIDKKGRVSVPALFRQVLTKEEFNGIIIYQSFINPCLEACGFERIKRISEGIDLLDPYSAERDAFATAILGGSHQLGFDNEGRVILPEAFIKELGLTESVCFVGKGQNFEIWEPKTFEDYHSKARDTAKLERSALRLLATSKTEK